MTFRRDANRHNTWIKHLKDSAAQIAEIGLPLEVYETEQAFADFLTSGMHPDLGIGVNSLPDKQFWKLFDFVTSTFDCRAAAFTALERRRLRGRSTAGS
jgi:hypothetical protein